MYAFVCETTASYILILNQSLFQKKFVSSKVSFFPSFVKYAELLSSIYIADRSERPILLILIYQKYPEYCVTVLVWYADGDRLDSADVLVRELHRQFDEATSINTHRMANKSFDIDAALRFLFISVRFCSLLFTSVHMILPRMYNSHSRSDALIIQSCH